MKRRVVVTGIGAISPIGNNAETMWENAKKGMNGLPANIEGRDASGGEDSRICKLALSFNIIDEGRFTCASFSRYQNRGGVIRAQLL